MIWVGNYRWNVGILAPTIRLLQILKISVKAVETAMKIRFFLLTPGLKPGVNGIISRKGTVSTVYMLICNSLLFWVPLFHRSIIPCLLARQAGIIPPGLPRSG